MIYSCVYIYVSQETGPDADTCAVCIDLYKPGDVLSVLTCKYVSLSFTPFHLHQLLMFITFFPCPFSSNACTMCVLQSFLP